MGTLTSNGGGKALAAPQGGAQRFRVDDVDYAANPANMAELRRVLATTQLRFRAALLQLEKMQRRDALREEEAALLTGAVAKAQRFAYHDELTSLPNRHLLLDRFKLAVALAERHDKHVGLLFCDLDHFKHVNDALGHSAGDKLLQQVAVRLVACIRASDTACRYGGDEFVVLLPQLSDKKDAVIVANNIRAHLAAPYLIDGAKITMTTSLGIAVQPIDGHEYDDLVRVSDLAMYRDKSRRRSVPSILDATSDGDKKIGGLLAALLGPVEGSQP